MAALANRFLPYPKDATVIQDQTGGVYVVAGGAATPVASWANVPYTSYVSIDGYAITHSFLAYPADGTLLKGYTTGNTYVINGGFATLTTASPSAVVVDQWAIDNKY